jgi:predicted nucleic acid-binding protein
MHVVSDASPLSCLASIQRLDLDPLASLLRTTLDQGESEAISLALNTRAELTLIDEREGREIARKLGLRLTGTLGILIRAKLDGSLACLEDVIHELQNNYSFSLAPKLVERALREVGES